MSGMRSVFLLTCLGLLPLTTAAFDTNPSSARSRSLGDAVLSQWSEPSTVFTNPGGLATSVQTQLSVLLDKPWLGLPDINLWSGSLCAAIPVGFGNLGLGYTVFQTDSLLRDQTVALGYGLEIWEGIGSGVTLKYLRRDYTFNDEDAAQDPIFHQGTGQQAVTIDWGVWAPLESCLRLGRNHQLGLGLSLRNLNQPDLGIASADPVLLEGDIGFNWKYLAWNLSIILDLYFQNLPVGAAGDRIAMNLGVEKKIFQEVLAVRGGYNSNEVTCGFGLRWDLWTLDYALSIRLNLTENNFGTHTMGLTYRLGESTSLKKQTAHANSVPYRASSDKGKKLKR